MQPDKPSTKKPLPGLNFARKLTKLQIFDPINKSFKGKIINPTILVLIVLVVIMNYYLSIRFFGYSN